jgi:hypothetical protein
MDVHVLLKQNPQLSATQSPPFVTVIPSDHVINYETHPVTDSSQPYMISGLQFGDLTFSNAVVDSSAWTNSFTGFIHGLEPGKQDLRIITTSSYFGCADTSNFVNT